MTRVVLRAGGQLAKVGPLRAGAIWAASGVFVKMEGSEAVKSFLAGFCYDERDEEMMEEKRTGKEMQSVTNRAPLLE
uniref:Uncharacterized protein n=1 Tax=Salix viminalis TaxID=40686 RepID=A0A6N2L1A7_SALVM